jgi:lipid A ethanolaminephosphotransferase
MWFGENFDQESLVRIEETRKKRLSHDNMFSTLLGLFEIRSTSYEPQMDLLDHSNPEHL